MKKILVIEDDFDTLDIVGTILEYDEFDVVKFDRKVSIAEISDLNPNIIIIDYLLKDGFGTELCLEIKSNPLVQHIPVILYSAHPNLEKLASDSFANGFINKPFDMDDFLDLVKKLL